MEKMPPEKMPHRMNEKGKEWKMKRMSNGKYATWK